MDKKTIGLITGGCIVTAAGVATAAAISRGVSSRKNLWAEGYVEGYDTYPGDQYDVYEDTEAGVPRLIMQPHGIWFREAADWYKFLYDALRDFGLTPGGAIVAIGHAMKAGVHSTGRRTPMRGWSNWGVKAGKSWRAGGGLYWVADTKEFDPEIGQEYDVPDETWRFYDSIDDAIDNWLRVMKLYPDAYNQLFAKAPDPNLYAYGLKHGTGGRQYATGAFDMAQIVSKALEQVPEALNAKFGYNLQGGMI